MEQNKPNVKIEKVVQNKVIVKKESEFKKFFKRFFAKDVDDIQSYLVSEVLIPEVKRIISSTVDVILYGGVGSFRNERRDIYDGRAYTRKSRSYDNFYDGDRRRRSIVNQVEPMTTRNGDNVIFQSRGDAELVVTKLADYSESYDVPISVKDMLDAAGLDSQYTDISYGWESTKDFEVVRVRDGYTIQTPRPIILNDGK